MSGAHCLGCAVANSVTRTGRTVKTPRGRAGAVVPNSQPTLRTSRRLRVARHSEKRIICSFILTVWFRVRRMETVADGLFGKANKNDPVSGAW